MRGNSRLHPLLPIGVSSRLCMGAAIDERVLLAHLRVARRSLVRPSYKASLERWSSARVIGTLIVVTDTPNA